MRRAEQWREPLLRSHRAIQITLGLIETADRLAGDAERLIERRIRPAQAQGEILAALGRLALAGRRASQSCRCLGESRDRIAAAAPDDAADAPRLLIEATAECILALFLIAAMTERVRAVGEFYRYVTVPIARGGALATLQRHRIPAHRAPFLGAPHDRGRHSEALSSSCAEEARQVFRGRAPPSF